MKRVLSAISSLLIPLAMVASLAACDNKSGGKLGADSQQMTLSPVDSKFINTDVTGLGYARDFSLTDHHGKVRTLADFKGKAVLVFFGFTQCPDVCPTTMAEMGTVMKELGPLADKVQVLFITLDPERDTQAVLAQYVPAFDSRFLGLYGDAAATEKVAKEFRVFYQKVPSKTPGNYTIDHTAGSYVFDPEGHVRLFVRHGQGAEPIVQDLKQLLK